MAYRYRNKHNVVFSFCMSRLVSAGGDRCMPSFTFPEPRFQATSICFFYLLSSHQHHMRKQHSQRRSCRTKRISQCTRVGKIKVLRSTKLRKWHSPLPLAGVLNRILRKTSDGACTSSRRRQRKMRRPGMNLTNALYTR